MRIKVKPEGRQDIYIPEKESLKVWIKSKNFEKIHNFIPGSGFILGADHEVEGVLEDIDNAERIALCILSNSTANIGHELSIIADDKLELYDIGKLTEEDLEIEK